MLDTNRHQTPTRLAAALLLPLLGVGLAQAQASVATGRQGTLSPARPGKAALPLQFEPNVGQGPAAYAFFARGAGYGIAIKPDELAVTTLHRQPGAGSTGHSSASLSASRLRFRLVGASTTASGAGEQRLPGVVNYLQGSDAERWRTHIPTFAKARFDNVYPGVDLVYYGKQGVLEYDFVVAPGADPDAIRIEPHGAEEVRLDETGGLLLKTKAGLLRKQPPVAYQLIGGRRQPVAAHYQLRRGEVRFALGDYDHQAPLVIDPVLIYSHRLGGSDADQANGVAVDFDGNAYVVGTTASTGLSTPGAAQGSKAELTDAFVAKLNPSGDTLLYATYLGGRGAEIGQGIALDASGDACVIGSTTSDDFPTRPVNRSFGSGLRGASDAFIAKLSANGAALTYALYLGGTQQDFGMGIAVDGQDRVYVTGTTESADLLTGSLAPTATPIQGALKGGTDAFVTRLDAGATQLEYSTYLGGNAADAGNGITVSFAGEATVVGTTSGGTFPGTKFETDGGPADAFVTRLNEAGTAHIYSRILGGTGYDDGRGVAVDTTGQAHVVGITFSPDLPVSGALLARPGRGGGDAFVSRLAPDGATLPFSTYLGGTGQDFANAVAVDSLGNTYVTGGTTSADFPVLNSLHTYAGGQDAFALRISAAAPKLDYSTLLGGSAADEGLGIAVDAGGDAYVAGGTASANFPTAGAEPRPEGTPRDAFLARVPRLLPAPNAPTNLRVTRTTEAVVELTWDDQSPDESGFELWRSLGAGSFERLAQLPANTTTYADGNVTADTEYRYQVRAVSAQGASAFSNIVTARTLPAIPAPTGLRASGITETSVRVEWSAPAVATKVELQRKPGLNSSADFTKVVELPAGTTFYVDTGLTPDTEYQYRLITINAAGSRSAPSATLSVKTSVLAAPSNLRATTVSATSISLEWNDNSQAESAYEVERMAGTEQAFTVVARLDPGVTQYTDPASPNTLYSYRVRAVRGDKVSAYSNTVQFRTPSQTATDLFLPTPRKKLVLRTKLRGTTAVPVPNPRSKSVLIRNRSEGELTVSVILLDPDSQFSIEPTANFTIPRGTSKGVKVTLAGNRKGHFTGELVLRATSQDGRSAQEATIKLNGSTAGARDSQG